MSTISADVTNEMIEWADAQVKKGLYKSRSEVIREMFREKMIKESFPLALASNSTLTKIWDNKEDEIWEKYL